MAWIRTISDTLARGPLRSLYDAAYQRAGRVFHIVRVMGLNPPVLRASMDHYRAAMFGPSPLSRAQRELIAVVVSRCNLCDY